MQLVLQLVPAIERLPDLAPLPFAIDPPLRFGVGDEQHVHVQSARPCDQATHEGDRGFFARSKGVFVTESLRLLRHRGIEEFADAVHNNRLESVMGGGEGGELLNDGLEV